MQGGIARGRGRPMKHGKRAAAAICGIWLLGSFSVSAAGYEYDPYEQANLRQIGVTEALHETLDGSGFGIAIFDGEFDTSHADFGGRSHLFYPYSGSYGNPDFHGTHVAGIAGAQANGVGVVGVAPGAQVSGYPVFDDYDWVAYDNGRAALEFVRFLNGYGANIVAVNMSYGPERVGDIFMSNELPMLDDYRNEVVIVRAAGNDGVRAQREYYPGTPSKQLGHILIVGSVDENNQISSFSNRAGNACIGKEKTCGLTQKIRYYFIVAPGRDILSDHPDQQLAWASGTSMAAPHVAGAVALIAEDAKKKRISLKPKQIASIIKESATDLGKPGIDTVYGWGLLNVPAALGPVGGTTLVTSPTVQAKTGQQTTRNAIFGNWSYSSSSVTSRSLLSGIVVFDAYGRPFEANADAFVDDSEPSLSERGLEILGLVSNYKTVDFDNGDTAVLAWNATGMDGEVSSALRMVTGGTELSIGIGAPELFLSDVPSQNRAAAPQRFSQIMFSSLGEAGDLFGRSISLGFGSQITERLSGNIFAVTESTLGDETQGLAVTDRLVEEDAEADFAAIGLSYRVTGSWSVGGSYAVLRERGSVVGMVSEGALSLGEEALTRFQGMNVTGDFDDTWSLAAFYTRATIDSSGTAGSLFDPADGWSGDHYGLMLDGRDLVSEGSLLRFSLVKPLQITSGTMSVRVPVGREFDGTINYERRSAGFDSSAMPLEAGVTYLAETGYGTFGLTLELVDTNVNGAGESGASIGAGFSFAF